ncbi:MAG TPA: hypothetical protein VGQ44_11630 [Gemmatimonadaceae bacterium]|jgi:hypothetical protein|nr:hypothetical protein [Gemmatimonadaceae bacterium]
MAAFRKVSCLLWQAMLALVIPVTLSSQQTDTRLSARVRDGRIVRSTADGEVVRFDTLTVVAGPGIRGQIGAQEIRPGATSSDDIRTLTVVWPRGKRLPYAIVADAGYQNPIVLLDDDSIGVKGTVNLTRSRSLAIAADRAIGVRSANRQLYELLRRQLTAADPLSAHVDVECETARLRKAFPDSGETLIDAAEQRAIDPMRDAKALRRLDKALSGHAFEGCRADRKTYQKKS